MRTQGQRSDDATNCADFHVGNLLLPSSHFPMEQCARSVKNARLCQCDLAQQLEIARRYSRPLSIVLAEIDGDADLSDGRLVRAVGRRIAASKRRADFVRRWGDREFMMILPETDLAAARTFSERLQAAIGATPFKGKKLTISVGVNQCNPEDEAADCLTAAFFWLERAKLAGKSRIASCLDIMSHPEPADAGLD